MESITAEVSTRVRQSQVSTRVRQSVPEPAGAVAVTPMQRAHKVGEALANEPLRLRPQRRIVKARKANLKSPQRRIGTGSSHELVTGSMSCSSQHTAQRAPSMGTFRT